MKSAARTWLALQTAFVLSGACALAYEVVWGRWLATVIGSSAIATCIVLAGYMGPPGPRQGPRGDLS